MTVTVGFGPVGLRSLNNPMRPRRREGARRGKTGIGVPLVPHHLRVPSRFFAPCMLKTPSKLSEPPPSRSTTRRRGRVVDALLALRAAGPAGGTLACVAVEATGGLERPVVDALLDAGLPVAVANPAHVRHLAKGLGILAKTDAADARVLAAFARHAA